MMTLMLALSSSLAASIVAKATVTTAFSLLAVRLARRSRAAVRYALLAAAFGVLLALPVASLVVPPLRIAVGTAVQERTTLPAAEAVTESIQPVLPTEVTPAIPRAAGLSTTAVLLAGWILGMAVFLVRVGMGLAEVRSLRRSALPWPQGQAAVDQVALDADIHRRVEALLHESLPGPMTCGVLHPAIVLPRDAENWQPEDLNRALVHELEHVRRGDWITLCLAQALCAVYWFHPLVWAAWRKLALEAERSCDDAVLGASEATAYADQLVGLAQRLSHAPSHAPGKSPLLAMANRADLATRVSAVLDGQQRRGRAGKFPVALASGSAAMLVLTISPLTMVAAYPVSGLDAIRALAGSRVLAVAAQAASQVGEPKSASTAVKHALTGPRLFQVAAQAAPPPVAGATMPRFISTTALIIVDVTVKDATGRDIEGLHRDDLEITEDGMPQAISLFEFQRLEEPSQGGADQGVSSYYIVGYYTPDARENGNYRKIKVTRKGDATGSLESRSGYYSGKDWGPNSGAIAPNAADPGAPIPIYMPEAQYSEEARKAKWQGSVTLSIEVATTGVVTNINVIRSLGLGLDEKAIQAVGQWKFKPGMKGGQPVPTLAEVEVMFRLL